MGGRSKDPESASMRHINIKALPNLHVTENDNEVYVPNYLFRLDGVLGRRRSRAEAGRLRRIRPHVRIHLIFTNGSEKYHRHSWKFSSCTPPSNLATSH